MNSTEWWSPDPGNTPNRRRISNRTRLFSRTSSFDQNSDGDVLIQCMSGSGSIQMDSVAARSGSSMSSRSWAKPSSPFTRSSVASGKWFTPARTGSSSCIPQPSARLRLKVAPTHSLHSPTVFTDVSRVTDRTSAVSGLVTLMNHASGATFSTLRAMSTMTGMLRSARMTPPGPTLSPMGWRMP